VRISRRRAFGITRSFFWRCLDCWGECWLGGRRGVAFDAGPAAPGGSGDEFDCGYSQAGSGSPSDYGITTEQAQDAIHEIVINAGIILTWRLSWTIR